MCTSSAKFWCLLTSKGGRGGAQEEGGRGGVSQALRMDAKALASFAAVLSARNRSCVFCSLTNEKQWLSRGAESPGPSSASGKGGRLPSKRQGRCKRHEGGGGGREEGREGGGRREGSAITDTAAGAGQQGAGTDCRALLRDRRFSWRHRLRGGGVWRRKRRR